MKDEERATSLELSKELKELGEPQNSFWYWLRPGSNNDWKLNYGRGYGFPDKDVVSAFTVTELMNGLPQSLKTKRLLCTFHLAKEDRKSTRLNSSHIPLSRMPSSA